MKRSKHNLSHYRMHTCDMGQLVPIACVPVLPGDTIQHRTSALIRVSPLNTPVMHPVQVRIHHFFVPNRIIWPESEGGGWEQFITGGPDGNDQQTIPTSTDIAGDTGVMPYLGYPKVSTDRAVNVLPLRGLNAIYNEYYRDQDLSPVRDSENSSVPRCNWEKDYLTTARPWAQKGPDITLPLGQYAPVVTNEDISGQVEGESFRVEEASTPGQYRSLQSPTADVEWTAATGASPQTNVFADLGAGSQININEFRAGFALQRYQEARARYGSRFTEYLRYLGITPSDARLQRPEYLGGGVTRLNFSEVLQTTPGTEPDTAGVGDLYGHGIAGVRTNAYRKFFEEHGYVYTMLSVRPKSIYADAAPREFHKSVKEDFFQRELANLGQQEVWKSEVQCQDEATLEEVFGFADRYDEYRSQPSYVGNDFRDLLSSWHLGRFLPEDVTLNHSFVQCEPSKRIHQVETDDSLWVMANHHMVARRLVPKRAYPRIL